MGYRVVTTDNVASNPGHRLADRAYSIDTTDRHAILALAQHERVAGVIAACTDVALPAAALVAERLGLPGPPIDAVTILCDKGAFRQWQRAQSLPCPDFYVLSPDEPTPPVDFDDGAWVVKPDSSSGSKGVFIVGSHEDLSIRLPQSRPFSRNRRCVLERCLEGTQHTCEGILQDGRIVRSWILDRRTAPPPHTATWGHRIPTSLSASAQEAVVEAVGDAWKRLRVDAGPFDCDFVWDEDRRTAYLLELAPRLGGNAISALVKHATSFDLAGYAVGQACGADLSLAPAMTPRPTHAVLLGVASAGRLAYDTVQAAALGREAWVAHLAIDGELHSPVQPFIDGRHRVGDAILFGHDDTDLDCKVAELHQRLSLRAE
jgi:biotin carboxylase